MKDADKVARIVAGMELYFRTFGLAEGVDLHAGDIEWIAPRSGCSGPAIVFKVSLNQRNVDARIGELLVAMQAGTVPALWVVSPTSTPASIVDHLLSSGFRNLSDAASAEPGMALEPDELNTAFPTKPATTLKTVTSVEDYALWINVVNEALHGGDLLTAKSYAVWLDLGTYTFYLAYREGVPAATLATFRYGDAASIEFVSTLAAHRRQGLAAALCIQAVQDLQRAGVKLITLRSSTEAVPLYTRLGFRPYYEQILLSYARQEDAPPIPRSDR